MGTADFPTMTTAEIRQAFLGFFEERGLALYPSSPLVPDDPSLLLANAGMNQFKQYYQGKKTMKEIGACSCQKCVRTNDIDIIGSDGRHLSFFEMLGDFSFGGVSKAQACAWAFELVTEVFKLPAERLHFTIFTEDDETHDVWRGLGVPEDHISRLGADDNFWAAGPTGPCGPCSEIYYDQGPEVGCGRADCKPGCDCDRFLEFWNLVFTQYDRQEDGSMPELPHKNLDTGMGLERMAAIMQHKSSNYDGDLMRSLIELAERLSNTAYEPTVYEGPSVSMRIIADAARAVDFLIADGVLPGNEGRGYVLRRLLRRAVFHGRLLGIKGPFLSRFIAEVNRLMGEAYPELVENAALVTGIVDAEEERFGATLELGQSYLADALAALAPGAVLAGERAFKLHDTYGFPVDLTVEIARAAGYEVDMEGFERCMDEQKARARAAAQGDAWGSFNDVWAELEGELAPTVFEGYERNSLDGARVLAIVSGGRRVRHACAGEALELVLDRTPFYAEMGGQVGDTGTLTAPGITFEVSGTKNHGGLSAHVGTLAQGELACGDELTATIDVRRRELIRRNHTATHLLDAALKQVLGEHVSQAGSLVEPERLRFDFTHFEACTSEQLQAVEDAVNEQIFLAKPVITAEMGIDEAKAAGAIALFGEKYGERVRVVSAGAEKHPFSRELCGGTHAKNTSEIGLFHIVSESSVGSNLRRIEAVSSLGALRYLKEKERLLASVAGELKCSDDEVAARVADMRVAARVLNQKLKNALMGGGSDKVQTALSAAVDCGAYKAIIARMDGLEAAELREVWDSIRNKAAGQEVACVLASRTPEGKVALMAAGTDGAVAAGFGSGDLIKKIAEYVGGRGGGRPGMAQAGGKDAAGIEAALAAARKLVGAED